MNELTMIDPVLNAQTTTKFFTYNQNNSGGSFVRNEDVSHYVIIEANSRHEADTRAESVGIYFDGCYSGVDCECCGDRWSTAWGDGDDEPNIYDEDPIAFSDMFCNAGQTYCIVHMLDGSKKVYRKQEAS